MSRINLVLIIASINLAGLAFIGYFTYHRSSIAYVSSNKLIDGYQGMIAARKIYQQKAVVWKANIDTLSSDVQKHMMQYEKSVKSMTPKERDLSLELIRTKQKQLMDYQQAMNAQAQQEDVKMTSEAIARINSYLKKYGEEEGYTIVMAATDYGNIAYADERLDITQEVLEGLNKEYSGQ